MKILVFKLNNLHTSACLKLNYGKTKQTKKVKVAKMVEFIKTYDQYPCRFNFHNFFNSIILPPPFCWGKNRSSENAVREEWVISFCLGVMTKTWGGGGFLLEGMSKNEQIQLFDSQKFEHHKFETFPQP